MLQSGCTAKRNDRNRAIVRQLTALPKSAFLSITLDKAKMVGVKNVHFGVLPPIQRTYAILVQSEPLHQM
jgi:hypothetical protein